MNRIVIFGVGGFGREIISPAQEYIAKIAQTPSSPPSLCFADDAPSGSVLGYEVIPFSDITPDDGIVIAVGSGEARKSIAERCQGLNVISLFSSSFTCGEGVEIGGGAVFCSNTMVTGSARIGRQFQCNIYSYVAHDCVIGDYVTFAPRVSCNGNVHIEDYAYIGTGAVIKQGTPDKPLRIGRGATVGMGAVVTKDVPAGAVVMGNPAKARE